MADIINIDVTIDTEVVIVATVSDIITPPVTVTNALAHDVAMAQVVNITGEI